VGPVIAAEQQAMTRQGLAEVEQNCRLTQRYLECLRQEFEKREKKFLELRHKEAYQYYKLTIHRNQGLDPEQGITGITYYRYPAMRTISGGINVSF